MEIYNGTGKLKTEELKVTKSVASLIITSSLLPSEFTTENITIFIERVNSPNLYIAQSVKLIDFLMLTNYGVEAIQSDATNATIALCELGDSAVQLNEGETLKIKLDNLKSASSYGIYAVEDPDTTLDTVTFDRKTIASEDLQRVIDVTNAHLCVIDMHSSIKEISFTYVNGSRVKYLPFELKVISRDVDPIYFIKNDGSVLQGHAQRVAIPLVGVSNIEFIKDAGTMIEITTIRPINLLNN